MNVDGGEVASLMCLVTNVEGGLCVQRFDAKVNPR